VSRSITIRRGVWHLAKVLGFSAALLPASAQLAPTACGQERVYEISLQPTPAGLQRTFSGWDDHDSVSLTDPSGGKTTPNGRLPDDELADLTKLYGERLTEPHELRQKFRGVFARRMPADVGGRGDYLVHVSPLGNSYAYLERFRGGDDIDLALVDRRAAVDTIVDILRDWVDAQLADSPRRAEVRRFVHQELRQDLRKLSLLPLNEAGQAARAGQSLTGRFEERTVVEEFANRVLQYALERDYFDADDIADVRLLLLSEVFSTDTDEILWTLVRNSFVRKTGVDAATGRRLFAVLDDEEKFIATLSDHVRKHPDFKRFAGLPGREADDDENLEPMLFLEYLTQKAFLFEFDERPMVRLELSLAGHVEPFSTNGEPDPARAATTRWTRYVDDQGMPTLCYAYWSVPAEKFQAEHFGKTAVAGPVLAGAAALFSRLSPAQQAELTKHLESMEPGDALRGRVTEFSFIGAADDAAKTTARRLLELLSEQL
jgi:hypothetical protein